MRNKAILFSSFLWLSSPVLADETLLENTAKQAVKDTATAVAPDTVEKVEAAKQTLENAKKLKAGVENAPDALKDQVRKSVKEAVIKQKITEAMPEDAKRVIETLRIDKETSKNLKEKIDSAPKSTKAIKNKAREKAIEKALDSLR